MARGLVKQLGLLGMAGILASCMSGDGQNPAFATLETPTTGATVTPALTLTHSPQPSNTPTSVPSSTPDVPLYDDGAWLLFRASNPDEDERNSHLWAANWDGTGLTDLLPDFFVHQYQVQPAVDGSPGRYVAAITSYGWSDKFMLILAHLPDGEVVANIPLTNPQTELIDRPSADDPDCTTYRRRVISSLSISDLRSLAWSPDGTQIAFSGAQDSTQTDVYRYSLTDGSVSRLTWCQHPDHASNLLWSPDGRYIAYDNISSALSTYPHYWVDGIWVVRADGSMVRRIASEDEWSPLEDDDWGFRPQKLGWTSDHTIAVYGLDLDYFNWLELLKEIDVDTGRSSTIAEGYYWGIAFVPEQDIWLVESYSQDGGIAYLIRDGVTNKVGPQACCWPVWSPDLDAFITRQGLVGIDGVFTPLDLPGGLPLISPDGAYWAYPKASESLEPEEIHIFLAEDVLRIGELGKQPQQRSEVPLGVIQWSPNSRSVLVTDKEGQLQYVAIAPDFELLLISHYDTRRSIGPWYYGEAIDD